jgi:hypothetical protein
VKTTMCVPSTRESREIVGRVETSVGEVMLVIVFCLSGLSGLDGVRCTVGEKQHVSFNIAGAIVGYDEVSFGGGLRVGRRLAID